MQKAVQITLIISITAVAIFLIGIMFINNLNPTQSNTITVNGLATIKAVPDLTTVYFQVQTKGETSKDATSKNSKIVEDLISNLVNQGFDRQKLQTSSFNVYPNYEWKNNNRVEDGYIAEHSIRLEMLSEDFDKIGNVIDAGVSAGAGIGYINFELSQEKQNEYKAEAMKLAAQDARIKAESVAQGFEKKLGKLISTSVDNFGYSPWRVYSASAQEDAATIKSEATSITPSEQEISVSVQAVYKLN
jgi:uncharacterized protein